MQELISRYATKIPLPLMPDSTQVNALEIALKLIGGRPIINSANLEDYKAGFIISKNDGSRAVLQSIENLENDDYSFTVSDGNYSYKKETVLSLENSFFDKTDGEFSLSLCLFNKTDNYLEVPVTGYQYNVAYKITDSKIAFEIKNGAVIRNH